MNYLANLATIKMDDARAAAFCERAKVDTKELAKYGNGYCYMPLLADSLVGLIKMDDYLVREAVANFFRELLARG